MKILFITANRLGDAVISCGVLDHLIRLYPACRVTVVCGPAAEGVFASMPNLERTIIFSKQPHDRHWLILWRQIVGTVWDLVVDFRGSLISYTIANRRRAVRRRRPGRMFEQHAAMLGIEPAPLPVVWTSAADRARAAALLPPGAPVIGVGPTANWPPKAWPTDRFASLIKTLANDGPLAQARCIIFAGPGDKERAMAAPLLAALPDAIDACGVLSVSEVAACLQRCAIFIGNDSGLMHLAAAAGVPTLGLCGATMNRAEEMAPAGPRAAWVFGRGEAMTDISVMDVRDACIALLEQRPPPEG